MKYFLQLPYINQNLFYKQVYIKGNEIFSAFTLYKPKFSS